METENMQIFEFSYRVRGLMGITIVKDEGKVTGYGEVPEAIKLFDYIRENWPLWRSVEIRVREYELKFDRKNIPHFIAQ